MPPFIPSTCVQRWAKEWALVCVNSPHAAGGSQEAGFTQPRAHSFAQPCRCPRKTFKPPPFPTNTTSDGKGELGADVNMWFVLVNEDHFKGTQYARAPGVTRVNGFDCAGEEGIATVRTIF